MKDLIKNLAARIEKNFDRIETEEATKNAFIMPFIQMLGYDIFDPAEVTPEYTADVGLKKGEKVDYLIYADEKPAILIECKCCKNDLNLNNESQLFRYFHVTRAKFSLLTNGIHYKFYTDLEEPNKMDTKPFLEFSLLELDKINYTELEKFTKANFDEENIRKTADLLKCSTSIRNVLLSELSKPSEDLVRLIFKKMDCGGSVFNEKAKEKITPLVEKAIESVISDKVKEKLSSALDSASAKIQASVIVEAPEPENTIVTTQEETDGHNIIKAIGAEITEVGKIALRDAKSYCAILFEDNNRRPICRFYFNTARKQIGFFDGESEEKVQINTPEDIYQYKQRILSAIKKYLQPEEK